MQILLLWTKIDLLFHSLKDIILDLKDEVLANAMSFLYKDDSSLYVSMLKAAFSNLTNFLVRNRMPNPEV